MKKKILTLLLLLGLVLWPAAFPVSAGAVSVSGACSNGAGSTAVCKELSGSNGNPIINTLKIVIEILAIVIGVASVIMIIIGGIKMIMSGGDPSAVKSGRDTVIYALIGVVIAIFAQAIVSFVLSKL
jgi:Type IV secretion system pilin